MSIYSKKEAKIQFYILYFAFIAITLYFILPQFNDYLTAKNWIEVEVTPKKKEVKSIEELLVHTNSANNAKLISVSDLEIRVRPNAVWGRYLIIREMTEFIFFFIGLWFVLKVLKSLQSEDLFKNSTSQYLSKTGWLFVTGGIINYLDKYFMNFYILKELEFSSYRIINHGGIYLLVGCFIVYFSRYYRKGIELQAENSLTI